MDSLVYVEAVAEDNKLLTETAIASKKIWGYPDDLINSWRSELEVSKEYILKNKVVKVYDTNQFIGFYGLKTIQNKVVEIDHLWLKPDTIKKGYGRIIFKYILQHLKSEGYKKATLLAEPNANGFYDKMGGKVIAQFQSKVSERFLDIYEYTLNT